jgi:hypothetical protein
VEGARRDVVGTQAEIDQDFEVARSLAQIQQASDGMLTVRPETDDQLI